jgi:hypothetical protein
LNKRDSRRGENHDDDHRRQNLCVSDVARATRPIDELLFRDAVSGFIRARVEACSGSRETLIWKVTAHPVIAALQVAFSTHRPVALSPDIVWLTICQGFAHHVNAHAQSVRRRLVRHDGRVPLVVRRDDFVKGSPTNPWQEVFAEFSEAIRTHMGASTHDLIVANFSTTGPVERAASEVILLDTMQAFFGYRVVTSCGIPCITLEGTPDDWRKVAERAQDLERFDLTWWVGPLRPILQQFVAAAEGNVDRQFWTSIIKWQAQSGSSPVSGWVIRLFPYLIDPEAGTLQRNPWLSVALNGNGPEDDEFPSLPAKTPFLWQHGQMDHAMEFVGGLIGIAQDPATLCLRPEVGWAVCEALAQRQSRRT